MRCPVLGPTSADWPEAQYFASVKLENGQIVVSNTLKGSLVLERCLLDGDLKYVVEVRSPRTMYNKLAESSESTIRIDYEPEELSKDYFVRTMLCADRKFDLSTRELDFVWQDKEHITIEPGMILAEGALWEMGESRNSILRFEIKEGESLKDGMFEVERSGSGETPFVIFVNESTHRIVTEEAYNNPLSHSIITGALIGVFSRIAKDYESIEDEEMGSEQDDEVEDNLQEAGLSTRLLNEISGILEEKGISDWESEDFDPALAATAIWPFSISQNQFENFLDDD